MNRPQRADQPLRFSKARDRALVLPLVGVLLFVSPLAAIFQMDFKIAGVPFTLIGLFTVWAALIAGAMALSRPLRDGEDNVGDAHADADGSRDDLRR